MDDSLIDSPVPALSSNPNNGISRRSNEPDARLKRVADYAKAALQRADPLASVIGVANSGLFSFATRFQDAIDAATDPSSPVPMDLRTLQPAIDSYLRIMRQIDRFTQLELRLTEPSQGR